jgi:hypothetical protein
MHLYSYKALSHVYVNKYPFYSNLIRPRLGRQVHPLASPQRTDHFWKQGQPAAGEAVGPQNRPITCHPVRHPPACTETAKNLIKFSYNFSATLTNQQ